MTTRIFLFLTLFWLIAAGCARGAATPLAARATATPTLTPPATRTPTATAIATAIATATPTPTPTPTFTPTPTAVAASISGDPRAAQEQPPTPTNLAPCGVVDLFDFPIDPPDASHVRGGGSDFGVWRSRYDKYHAGEDWRGPSSTTTLGTPVYSIGHGLVTYAQPLGWGRDQGVVIVRHTLADGSRILSFYGHLDPDSVVLAPGTCVARGQQVGNIGQPRTSPHLHFEIREQSPYAPLTGYWAEDPTLAGWKPPSQTIWNQRIAAAVGVTWARVFADAGIHPLTPLNENTFLLLAGNQLQSLNLADGSIQPALPDRRNVVDALPAANSSILYVADRLGRLDAVRLEAAADGPLAFTSLWTAPPAGNGAPQLLPLPGGGVLLAQRADLFAYDADGVRLWRQNVDRAVLDGVMVEEALYFTTAGEDGALWRLRPGGTPQAVGDVGGYLAAAGAQLWLYAGNGLYRLDVTAAADVVRVMSLPAGTPARGGIIPLPDGGALVAHTDPYDSRLIALAADGSLRWQTSVRGVNAGQMRPLLVAGQPYLAASSGGSLTLYAITPPSGSDSTAGLLRLFAGSSRTPIPADTWTVPIGPDHILLHIGGGSLAIFDPQAAHAILALPPP
ncbi:MAG: peptidoglycan DD-metalloendopeptidase family protein [Ardenticatenales bacterium]|nr:peptidoglycan DD-metalloendopeptidase family protein [Ardenticatenales bacterium]